MKFLPVAFANARKMLLPAELAIPMHVRTYGIDRHGVAVPEIELLSLGRGYVVFSPIDLTSGLLGTNTWGIDGYQPASAQMFLENLVGWAAK